MLTSLIAGAYAAGTLYGWRWRDLDSSPYPAPDAAEREMADLAARHADLCTREILGASTEQRSIAAFRLRGLRGDAVSERARPRLLVTAHIHAVEYIGAYVARAVAHRLLQEYGRLDYVTALLDAADVWIVPLLNPDGAARVWRRNGWSGMRRARCTATGVDPNRNFPFVAPAGRGGWNSASTAAGSPYYRGPHVLSEPECLALARLCKRERFCAAINFHSFGGVVYMPEIVGSNAAPAERALAVFRGVFQSHQRHVRYRPIPERSAKIAGQLDSFLLYAFGTPSVTVEVSRPGLHVLWPWHAFNFFWWANPMQAQRWVENDADATIHALTALLERTGGKPCEAAHPELAEQVS
jgi:predicted deacylase